MPLDLELEKLPERCHWKKKKFQKKGKDRSRKSLAQLLYFADIYVVYLQVWTRVFLAFSSITYMPPLQHQTNCLENNCLYLQFVYQMVSQVLRDVLVPAFPYTCCSGGPYGGHGSDSPRIIQQTESNGRASFTSNSHNNYEM